MPILKNQRHEKFAQLVADGESATSAYGKSGYKPNRQMASRLMAKDDVRGRIEEIKEASAERAEITRASVLDLIQDIIEEARDANQYGPAMTGAVKLGVDIGMFEQRTSNKHLVKSLNDMNEEELAAFLGNPTR